MEETTNKCVKLMCETNWMDWTTNCETALTFALRKKESENRDGDSGGLYGL